MPVLQCLQELSQRSWKVLGGVKKTWGRGCNWNRALFCEVGEHTSSIMSEISYLHLPLPDRKIISDDLMSRDNRKKRQGWGGGKENKMSFFKMRRGWKNCSTGQIKGRKKQKAFSVKVLTVLTKARVERTKKTEVELYWRKWIVLRSYKDILG